MRNDAKHFSVPRRAAQKCFFFRFVSILIGSFQLSSDVEIYVHAGWTRPGNLMNIHPLGKSNLSPNNNNDDDEKSKQTLMPVESRMKPKL
jgi:hypothetical protein